MKIRIANFYGGIPITQNKELLKKETPHIVIGTPGRIKAVSAATAVQAAIRTPCTVVGACPVMKRRAVV